MNQLLISRVLHEHQVPNPDSNLDHNPHGRGGLSLDSNPVCLRVNATSLDKDLNARVNGAIVSLSKLVYESAALHFFWSYACSCRE